VKLMLPLLLVIALSASAESALVLERLEYTDHGKSGSELESPLEVRLTSARSGNPVPDYPVYFAVTGGSAELLPAEGCLTLSGEPSEGLVVHTDSSGIARVGLSLGRMGEVAVTERLPTTTAFNPPLHSMWLPWTYGR